MIWRDCGILSVCKWNTEFNWGYGCAAVGILYGWSYFVWDLDYVGHGVDHFGLQLNLIMEV